MQAGLMVTASSSTCSWTVSSNQDWAQVYPLSGKGTSNIQYTVFPNFSARSRSAVILVNGRPFSIVQAPASGGNDERFVNHIYFNFFGRRPSPVEAKLQVSQGLALGRASMVLNFLQAAEFNAAGRFVAGLYTALLDRDPEYGGWLFQRNAISTGQTNPLSLVSNFLSSEEYKLKFGTQTDRQFIQSLYRSVLLREAQPQEITLQASALAGGLTRVQLASAILYSAEFQKNSGPRVTAFLLYATLLNRTPTNRELNSRAAEMSANVPVLSLIDGILDSAEFQNVL
jgi:hypothetical protein